MVNQPSIAALDVRHASPSIRKIDFSDLVDVLAKGVDDFKAKPSHIFLLALIYPIIGVFLFALTFSFELLPLLFPLVAGFTLIGPIAALGLYELSKRREQGLELSWKHAAKVYLEHSSGSVFALGLLQLVIYFVWIAAAFVIYKMIFGDQLPTSISELIQQVTTTPEGTRLIIVGCGVGFLFALLVLAISVVSFPLLVDRDVGARLALETSVRSVRANPITMAMWGLIVAVILVIGCLPYFVGLAVALPILGHATWHLYRRLVSWDD